MPGSSVYPIAEPAPKTRKTAFGLLSGSVDGRVASFRIIRRHHAKHLGLVVEPIEEVLPSISFACQKDFTTRFPAPRQGSRWIYPRGCGATSVQTLLDRLRAGLSPRVRGYHIPLANVSGLPRSIPAGAGLPAGPTDATICAGAYPRGCGATADGHLADGGDVGLSPRVRGYPIRYTPGSDSIRSIPAGAGLPIVHPVSCNIS